MKYIIRFGFLDVIFALVSGTIFKVCYEFEREMSHQDDTNNRGMIIKKKVCLMKNSCRVLIFTSPFN